MTITAQEISVNFAKPLYGFSIKLGIFSKTFNEMAHFFMFTKLLLK